MKERGQILIVVAVLLAVGMTLLAVAVDGGRLYIERGRLERAVQAAADAAIGVVGDEMVRLAELRRGEGAETCQPSPQCYLQEEDWQALESDPLLAERVEQEARDYAARNGLKEGEGGLLQLSVEYPLIEAPGRTLGVRVTARREVAVLLVGLLGESFYQLNAAATSVIPGRPEP
jgi:hypothetical protein